MHRSSSGLCHNQCALQRRLYGGRVDGKFQAADFQGSLHWLTENAAMVQVAITNAATMEEVHRLESALKAGRMPEALPEGTNGATVMDEG